MTDTRTSYTKITIEDSGESSISQESVVTFTSVLKVSVGDFQICRWKLD